MSSMLIFETIEGQQVLNNTNTNCNIGCREQKTKNDTIPYIIMDVFRFSIDIIDITIFM